MLTANMQANIYPTLFAGNMLENQSNSFSSGVIFFIYFIFYLFKFIYFILLAEHKFKIMLVAKIYFYAQEVACPRFLKPKATNWGVDSHVH